MEDDDEAHITKNISVFSHNDGCPPHSPTATFLEVLCRGEEKFRRFASGTKAGFALHRINRKLGVNVRAATCIEAVKDGEDPVEFGPDAELVIYGPGWRLQTLHEQDLDFRPVNSSLYPNQSKQNPSEVYPTSKVKRRSNSKFTSKRIQFMYMEAECGAPV
ncbi:hypothetical protein SUGI_0318170 [Cryptomeria japonica]|uniref:uncharacterized protein LOC131047146 isoform X2 n=1 Tax=Cryptomeria japonica TaxID=3369 RepID=UPI002408BE01|nr:uncharacterized protein LOC131047146 isoform X2 [Cryptomeria japonica]GLJ18031.1 hypothetical protein SUGI_0318170 [Cryptomeria japonica]